MVPLLSISGDFDFESRFSSEDAFRKLPWLLFRLRNSTPSLLHWLIRLTSDSSLSNARFCGGGVRDMNGVWIWGVCAFGWSGPEEGCSRVSGTASWSSMVAVVIGGFSSSFGFLFAVAVEFRRISRRIDGSRNLKLLWRSVQQKLNIYQPVWPWPLTFIAFSEFVHLITLTMCTNTSRCYGVLEGVKCSKKGQLVLNTKSMLQETELKTGKKDRWTQMIGYAKT